VHDQWRTRTSSSSAEEFDYDTNGRLVTVRDTVGGDCATRAYVYDAVANRKSSTAFPSAEDGSCQRAAGGVSSSWGYDTGDRIADAGYTVMVTRPEVLRWAAARTARVASSRSDADRDLVARRGLPAVRKSWSTCASWPGSPVRPDRAASSRT
jgi:YD repeat-containing protein